MTEEKGKAEAGGSLASKKAGVRQKKVLGLVFGLVLIVLGGTLFIGAVAGWFSDSKVVLDEEYYCSEDCSGEFTTVSVEELEKLRTMKKSFILFVDQGGCQTAERIRGYLSEYMKEKGVKAYRISFSNLKESSFYPTIRYYPSVAIVADGEIRGFLRADAEEDSDAYNNQEAFFDWIEGYLGV